VQRTEASTRGTQIHALILALLCPEEIMERREREQMRTGATSIPRLCSWPRSKLQQAAEQQAYRGSVHGLELPRHKRLRLRRHDPVLGAPEVGGVGDEEQVVHTDELAHGSGHALQQLLPLVRVSRLLCLQPHG